MVTVGVVKSVYKVVTRLSFSATQQPIMSEGKWAFHHCVTTLHTLRNTNWVLEEIFFQVTKYATGILFEVGCFLGATTFRGQFFPHLLPDVVEVGQACVANGPHTPKQEYILMGGQHPKISCFC